MRKKNIMITGAKGGYGYALVNKITDGIFFSVELY